PPPQGRIAWWKGDGTTSDSFATFNGTFGGIATYQPGEVEQAFSFDGKHYVDIPWSQQLNPSAQMSVEAWVYPTAPSGWFNPIINSSNETHTLGYVLEWDGDESLYYF